MDENKKIVYITFLYLSFSMKQALLFFFLCVL